jgi:hypothetical protein
MPNSGYFDVKRDIEIEKSGGFWCHACLVSHPATEQSPDPRYCEGCYEFLLKEAEMLPASKCPAWIPKPQKPEKAGEKQYQVSEDVVSIMSTLEGKKFEVDIIHPPGATRAVVKRGPKHRQLPEDLIRQLASEGMGSKVIAARLKAEHGIIVSYKTIQRILSGERKQLALPMSAP